jgi:phytoene dehydrogenase-like protein
MSRRYDCVVVGGGHNGLVTAAYLARAGRRTLVLERRPLVGGAAVTEETNEEARGGKDRQSRRERGVNG